MLLQESKRNDLHLNDFDQRQNAQQDLHLLFAAYGIGFVNNRLVVLNKTKSVSK